MMDQKTYKLGRVTLVDGVPQKIDFQDHEFHRRPHFLVFHAKPAYDDDAMFENKELLQYACKGCRFEGIRIDLGAQYRAFDCSEEGVDKSNILQSYTQRNYPMVNNNGMTLGARQTVCLSAGDISFRPGSEKVPVIARGHVRVSSDYGITGTSGYGKIFADANPIISDCTIDVFMTEFSRAYLEVGDSKIRRFVK